jgi:fucose 4-O-acetylase-like acetyltransferase
MGVRPQDLTSEAIRISRILGILGIIYVHAWTGRTWDELNALAGTPQIAFRWVLIDLLGRSAVPLLSVISGWLVAASVQRRSYGGFVRDKATTLLAPMLAWNLIAMTLVCGAAQLGWLHAPRATSIGWVLNQLVCLTGPNDVNVQISFLRDLFVIMLAAPLLVRLPSWVLALIAAAAAVWCVGGWSLLVLLRPQILVFFILGVLARRRDWEKAVGRWRWVAAATPFCVIGPVSIALSIWGQAWSNAHPAVSTALDLGLRLAAAILFWRTAVALAPRPAGRALSALSPLAFLMFCAHMTLIWFGGELLLGRLTGPLGAPAYPAVLLVQPLLVLAATALLREGLMALSPGLTAFLSGGQSRVARRRQATASGAHPMAAAKSKLPAANRR